MKEVKSISIWYVLWGMIFGINCGYIWIWSRLGEGMIIGVIMMWVFLIGKLVANLYYKKREYNS